MICRVCVACWDGNVWVVMAGSLVVLSGGDLVEIYAILYNIHISQKFVFLSEVRGGDLDLRLGVGGVY